jgi:hypothetical protein
MDLIAGEGKPKPAPSAADDDDPLEVAEERRQAEVCQSVAH